MLHWVVMGEQATTLTISIPAGRVDGKFCLFIHVFWEILCRMQSLGLCVDVAGAIVADVVVSWLCKAVAASRVAL